MGTPPPFGSNGVQAEIGPTAVHVQRVRRSPGALRIDLVGPWRSTYRLASSDRVAGGCVQRELRVDSVAADGRPSNVVQHVSVDCAIEAVEAAQSVTLKVTTDQGDGFAIDYDVVVRT